MIPNEAVAAALVRLCAAPIVQELMRAALEAAAPHMLAEAWEAGHRTCRLDPDSIEFNPYRAHADREPEPGDGPDYHAEHSAWESRHKK